MSLYRCAACGSPNVAKVEKNDGFSYGKALVGTAVFGTIGAVAGINGKKRYVYSCPDCGKILPNPMDDITKDKIDLVMTNPDLLVPRIYPTLYENYAYLRKEKEMRDAREVEKASTYSTDYANPLNISENEFRHAAKASRDALNELSSCCSCYRHSDSELHPVRDANMIAEGLRSLRTITFGVSAYPSLIMNQSRDDSGLGRNDLCTAAVLYILLENGGKMSDEDFYSCVMSNPIYQQLFMTIFGDEYQKQYVYFRDVISVVKTSTLNAYGQQRVWKNTMHKFFGCCFCLKDMSFTFREDKKIMDFPFKLINDSLYAENPKSLEEQLEEDKPMLAKEISEAKHNVEELEKRINGLSQEVSAPEQKAAEDVILDLKNEASALDSQIAKLRRRFFCKKRAAEEIQTLEAKQQEISKKIAVQNAVIEKVKEQTAAKREQKKALLEKQLSEAQQSLEQLQKQKAEYALNYPEWICIAGPDLKS